jgi:hypothetical protein
MSVAATVEYSYLEVGNISMYFIVGMPLTARKYDSNWVIVDRFTKSTHFIHVHTRYKTKMFGELYIEHILCLHGVPNTIISN